MSPADRTSRQRRFRPSYINPVLVRLSMTVGNESPSRNTGSMTSSVNETTENEPTSVGVDSAQEEYTYMDIPCDDQEILESAFDAFEMTGDDFQWDDISMTGQNDPMDLDEQSK